MDLFCSLTSIYVKAPEGFKGLEKDNDYTDIEQRVSTSNLRVNYNLMFATFTWIFLSIRSTP